MHVNLISLVYFDVWPKSRFIKRKRLFVDELCSVDSQFLDDAVEYHISYHWVKNIFFMRSQ